MKSKLRVATRLLLAILDGKQPDEPVITIPTELIRRQSVGPVRTFRSGAAPAPVLTAD